MILRFAELRSFGAVSMSLKEGKKITTSSHGFACLMGRNGGYEFEIFLRRSEVSLMRSRAASFHPSRAAGAS